MRAGSTESQPTAALSAVIPAKHRIIARSTPRTTLAGQRPARREQEQQAGPVRENFSAGRATSQRAAPNLASPGTGRPARPEAPAIAVVHGPRPIVTSRIPGLDSPQ